MRAALQLLLCFVLATMAGCLAADRNLSFKTHIEGELPATAKLVHSGAKYAGIDASYAFVFTVEDDALLDLLIAKWNLSRSDSPSESGFFDSENHEWWPSDQELSEIMPNYSRSDEEMEEYWIVWPDSKTG